LNYADEFSWDKSAQEFLEVLDCVWRSDEEAILSRFYSTLNMFGTFAETKISEDTSPEESPEQQTRFNEEAIKKNLGLKEDKKNTAFHQGW